MAHLTGPQVEHQYQFAAKAPNAQRRHDAGLFFAADHAQKTQRLLPPDMVGRQNCKVTQTAEAAAQIVQGGTETGHVMAAIKLIEFWTGHAQSMVQRPDESDEQNAANFVGRFLAPVSVDTFSNSNLARLRDLPQKSGHHLLLIV